MEIRMVTDRGGNSLPVKFYDGVNFSMLVPGNVKDHLEAIGNMDVRENDTIILSYPKSGTHWVYEIVNMLRTGKTDYYDKMLSTIDFLTADQQASLTSPRVLASHFLPRYLPKSLIKQKTKIVYVCRNPKDVAVSFFNFIKQLSSIEYGGSIEDFVDMWIQQNSFGGSSFDFVKAVAKFMEANPEYPILTVSFEDMKKDLEKEVKRINTFLECGVSDELCKEIASRCQFSAMSAAKHANVPERVKHLSKTEEHIFYRKGNVGDWKNWFTVSMNEKFDAFRKREMTGVDLKHFSWKL